MLHYYFIAYLPKMNTDRMTHRNMFCNNTALKNFEKFMENSCAG